MIDLANFFFAIAGACLGLAAGIIAGAWLPGWGASVLAVLLFIGFLSALLLAFLARQQVWKRIDAVGEAMEELAKR